MAMQVQLSFLSRLWNLIQSATCAPQHALEPFTARQLWEELSSHLQNTNLGEKERLGCPWFEYNNKTKPHVIRSTELSQPGKKKWLFLRTAKWLYSFLLGSLTPICTKTYAIAPITSWEQPTSSLLLLLLLLCSLPPSSMFFLPPGQSKESGEKDEEWTKTRSHRVSEFGFPF